VSERFRIQLHQAMPRRRFVKVAGIGSLATISGLLASCNAQRADDDEPEAATDDVAEADEPDDDDEPVDDEDEVAAEDEADDVAEVDDEFAEVRENFEPFDAQELDLETLEVEFPNGPTTAEPWDNTWVGQVSDDLFIGIRIADAYGDAPREVTAYLCDNDFWAVLDGELVDDAAALSDEDDETEVNLELIDDEITGSVSLAGQSPMDFSAEPASGDAGVYVAATEIDEVEVTGRWIVLEDGQQRGTEICCSFACCPPIGACWPCREQL
jgi:hypothetical protein